MQPLCGVRSAHVLLLISWFTDTTSLRFWLADPDENIPQICLCCCFQKAWSVSPAGGDQYVTVTLATPEQNGWWPLTQTSNMLWRWHISKHSPPASTTIGGLTKPHCDTEITQLEKRNAWLQRRRNKPFDAGAEQQPLDCSGTTWTVTFRA